MSDNDDLQALKAQLNGRYIRDRQAGIQRAAEMLDRDQQRDQVLALLKKTAQDDQWLIVREAAQKVLDDDERRRAHGWGRADEQRHIFAMTCEKCHHVTYFDRRRICGPGGLLETLHRIRGEQKDQLYLKCENPDCGHEQLVRVDCEGYR